MKRILFVITSIIVLSALAFSQSSSIPTPIGPNTKTLQYSRSSMRLSPHDFTSDSGSVKSNLKSICAFCHQAHQVTNAPAGPLWARNLPNQTFGTYGNANSLDASPVDVGLDHSADNYSAFCLGCHDGSALFAASAYAGGKVPFGLDTTNTGTVDDEYNFNGANDPSAKFSMNHVHPVNFTYDAALATTDGGLFTPANNHYVYLDNSTTPPTAIGRLFNGKMQCSSCHNPHFLSSGIGIEGSTTYSKLCIACHKK